MTDSISSVPKTSVVIRSFNEERWLPELFAALHKQVYRDFEVLVVDSGSVDRTREIAAANGARIVRLRSDDFTFGHSLNVGIEQARGSLVAIVWAHAIPTDDRWLERLIAPLAEANCAMVFGGQRGHAISKFSGARDFERVFHSKRLVMDDDHVFVNNANSAIRKDLWSSIALTRDCRVSRTPSGPNTGFHEAWKSDMNPVPACITCTLRAGRKCDIGSIARA